MAKSTERFLEELDRELGPKFDIQTINGGLSFEYSKARLKLAEFDLESSEISIPIEAEFPDQPQLSGTELETKAMELLRPRVEIYQRRGYDFRDMKKQPGQKPQLYDEGKIPVVVVYLKRTLDDREALSQELLWLVEQLPDR